MSSHDDLNHSHADVNPFHFSTRLPANKAGDVEHRIFSTTYWLSNWLTIIIIVVVGVTTFPNSFPLVSMALLASLYTIARSRSYVGRVQKRQQLGLPVPADFDPAAFYLASSMVSIVSALFAGFVVLLVMFLFSTVTTPFGATIHAIGLVLVSVMAIALGWHIVQIGLPSTDPNDRTPLFPYSAESESTTGFESGNDEGTIQSPRVANKTFHRNLEITERTEPQ